MYVRDILGDTSSLRLLYSAKDMRFYKLFPQGGVQGVLYSVT